MEPLLVEEARFCCTLSTELSSTSSGCSSWCSASSTAFASVGVVVAIDAESSGMDLCTSSVVLGCDCIVTSADVFVEDPVATVDFAPVVTDDDADALSTLLPLLLDLETADEDEDTNAVVSPPSAGFVEVPEFGLDPGVVLVIVAPGAPAVAALAAVVALPVDAKLCVCDLSCGFRVVLLAVGALDEEDDFIARPAKVDDDPDASIVDDDDDDDDDTAVFVDATPPVVVAAAGLGFDLTAEDTGLGAVTAAV